PRPRHPAPAMARPARTRRNMRIVVLGGTFDPVHRGHIETAKDAARTLGASFGVLAVGDSHPHRPIPSLERDARVALVRLACTREPDIVEAGQLGADGTDLITVARQLSTTANELHFV